MIVLDTNVISNQMSERRDFRVHEWMNNQDGSDLFLTAITISELFFGAWIVKDPKRQEDLLQTIQRIWIDYAQNMLVFDDRTAEIYSQLAAGRQLTGRPIETKDAMIAAICLCHGATLATRNVRDFEGLDVKLVNPFEAT